MNNRFGKKQSMDDDDEDLTSSSSSSSSSTFGNNSNSNSNYDRNSNSNYDPNMFSERGRATGRPRPRGTPKGPPPPPRTPMTDDEGDRLTDQQFLDSWTKAGVPQVPINIGTNRRIRQLFNYCSNTLNYLNNFGWGLMNYEKAPTYRELSKYGATINRGELTGAHTALMGSRAFHASTEGVKGDKLREYTTQVQYGCCKAVVDKVVNITSQDNPNSDNPNDNGAGLGNLMFDMLTDNAGEAKNSRSEIMAELIFIQVANIILYNISSQYKEGGVSWLEKQVRQLYGEEAAQQYKQIVTPDITLAYINRTWLYALLIFLDNNQRNNRAREIMNCPTSWFGFAALGATVFKYRDDMLLNLPHQIDSALKGKVQRRAVPEIAAVGSITNLTQLKTFLRDAIAVPSASVRYTKNEIVHLLTGPGFPEDNRPITLNSLDESIDAMSREIVHNAGNLSAIQVEIDAANAESTRAYDQYLDNSNGASFGDQRVHASALGQGLFDPMATRDDSQGSLDNWSNSQETAFSPTDNPKWQKFTVPTNEFLNASDYPYAPPPPVAARVDLGNSNIASSIDPYRRNYNTIGERSSITSTRGLLGLQSDNSSNSNFSNSNSANSNMQEEENNYDIGGKRRRRTRKTKKAKKTRKMTKPKKMRKSRKKR